VPIRELAARFTAQLAQWGPSIALSSDEVDRRLARAGIAQSRANDAVHESMVAWLAALEREHGHVVLVADADDTPWTRRCVRQADRVLVAVRATDDVTPGRLEQALAGMALTAQVDLVVLHGGQTQRPSRTLAWLAARTFASHHHVRMDDERDMRRLARRASGRATGLVLGGGGARGFAHIGALRALDEARIEVDMVGGTSIGAVIAGGHALGLGNEELTGLARSFASRKKILDRTLPIVALMEGRKVTSLYQHIYGEACIEDLWVPYFALSSGLTRAEAVLHTRGPLWRAARATTAVPAIFPPIIADDREVLVDGNVMNNMPLDVMRGWCGGGTVIGVNPMPIDVKVRDYRCGPSVSGWEALRGRWKLFGSTTRAPGIFGAIMRATEINSANRMRQPAFRALADLLIEPPVGDYPIMEYGNYAPIIEAGYRSASEAIERWQRGERSSSAAV
jgi:predicted acylesterase/phospholipase RssA